MLVRHMLQQEQQATENPVSVPVSLIAIPTACDQNAWPAQDGVVHLF